MSDNLVEIKWEDYYCASVKVCVLKITIGIVFGNQKSIKIKTGFVDPPWYFFAGSLGENNFI